MKKKQKASKSARERVKIRDLKAKDVARVKGGVTTKNIKGEATDKDHKDWIDLL
jgi:hypothetical protein